MAITRFSSKDEIPSAVQKSSVWGKTNSRDPTWASEGGIERQERGLQAKHSVRQMHNQGK